MHHLCSLIQLFNCRSNNKNTNEVKVAIEVLVKSTFAREVAPSLLTTAKNFGILGKNDELLGRMMGAYIEIMKQDSVGELIKILKYNRNVQLQLIAGKALIDLGNRQVVEDFVDRSESKKSLLIGQLTNALSK